MIALQCTLVQITLYVQILYYQVTLSVALIRSEAHKKIQPLSLSVASPFALGAQSPLKLDSFLHHARGNNLIKVQHRAMVAYHPIPDDSQSTNMVSK